MALVGLGSLDVNLPVELPGHILEDLVKDCLNAVKPLQSCFLWDFFIQSEILEPKWPVFWNGIKTFFTVLKSLLELPLPFLIPRRLKENWTILGTLFDQEVEGLSGLVTVSNPSFKESTF